ncbi:MAG: hypothetical protein GX039_00680 [Clostridia bacterium]|nr:hypothetical protein [Clostridia bacterium]
MQIPFLAWLLQGLPEAIGIAAVMYSVAGFGLRWRTIVPVGILFGVAFYLIRLLPIAFGVNTLLNFLLIVLVFQKATSCRLALAIRSGLAALIIVVVAENLFFILFVSALGLDTEAIYNILWLRLLVSWPNVIVLFTVAVIYNSMLNRRVNKENQVEYK